MWERADFIRGKVERLKNITRVGINCKSKQMRSSTCSQEPTYEYAAEEVLLAAQDDNTDTLMETEQLQQEDEAASAYSPKGLPNVISLSSFPSNNNEMNSNNNADTPLPTIPTSEIYASNDALQTNHMRHETSSEDFDMSLNDSVHQAVNEDDILLQLSSIFESREMDDLSSILSLNEDFRDPMISF